MAKAPHGLELAVFELCREGNWRLEAVKGQCFWKVATWQGQLMTHGISCRAQAMLLLWACL